MTDNELAYEIALGLIKLGVEGPYNAVSCSTAGDYPSLGVSQWEGSRGDTLLSYIDGGYHFSNRTYSDIRDSGELENLSALLDSEQGQIAQNMILSNDCLQSYLPALHDVPYFDNSRCIIYAGIWCPTSHRVVRAFLTNRADRGINNLETLRDLFFNEYYIAADVGEMYRQGYENRANNTFDYVSTCDLSKYGIY